MDLEEWEFLSDADDGFLDLNEDGGQKIAPKTILNMNHFICPSSPTSSTKHSTLPQNQFLHVPIHLDLSKVGKNIPDDDILKEIDVVEKMIKAPNIEGLEELKMIKAPSLEEVKMTKAESLEETDQDAVSQVFFKKMKENEFVDMKMDSPKSGNRGILPPMDAGSLRFDDEEDESDMKNEKKDMESDTVKEGESSWEEEEENNGGLNIWKWSLTGIGALSSIGVAAAAAICIIILGGHQRSKQHQSNQKLRFQIYTDDQDYSYLERGVLPYVVRVRVPSALFSMVHNTLGRIKQVVHHATKFNEVISTVRGVPLTRANITFGGYYNGL